MLQVKYRNHDAGYVRTFQANNDTDLIIELIEQFDSFTSDNDFLIELCNHIVDLINGNEVPRFTDDYGLHELDFIGYDTRIFGQNRLSLIQEYITIVDLEQNDDTFLHDIVSYVKKLKGDQMIEKDEFGYYTS